MVLVIIIVYLEHLGSIRDECVRVRYLASIVLPLFVSINFLYMVAINIYTNMDKFQQWPTITYIEVKGIRFCSIPRIFNVQNYIKIILAVNNYKHMEPRSRCDKSFPGLRRSLWKLRGTTLLSSQIQYMLDD